MGEREFCRIFDTDIFDRKNRTLNYFTTFSILSIFAFSALGVTQYM